MSRHRYTTSRITELVIDTHGRKRRIVAFDNSQGGPLCVPCALDHFGEELISDPAGAQSALYTPVYADDRKTVDELRGLSCYGTLDPPDHAVLPRKRKG